MYKLKFSKITLSENVMRLKRTPSFSKQRKHSVLRTALSALKGLSFLRKINSFEKTLIKFFVTTALLISLFWYAEIRVSKPQRVITISKETWKLLQDRINFDKNRMDHKNGDDFEKPSKQIKLKDKFKPPNKNTENVKPMPTEPLSEKDAWIFQVLRNSRNIKADPIAPKHSSYPIMKNGVRKPLGDKEPVILVWWPPDFLKKEKNRLLEREFQGVCGKCRLTTDRSTFHRSNVILFDNIPMKSNLEDLPPRLSRRSEQAYVLWHRETPAKIFHLKENMHGIFDKMFNYTLSYRRDSDIYWYLGNSAFSKLSMPQIHRKNPQGFVDKILLSKRHLAVWVVSNCDKTKGAVARMQYAKELIKAGLNLSKYGKCFGKTTPRKDFTEFLLPYKFYLAFENSWHCKDYLTEKFWRNGLMSNVVPVLWGPSPEDVAAVAPKHSYIHSEDFETPEALVKYLNYLDKNDTAYREYFNWRLEPILTNVSVNMIRTGYEPPLCKICRTLNENKGLLPYKVLPSAINWVFVDGEDSKCLLYDLE